MNTTQRKKSPRAPSISLGDAIEKVGRIYDKDRCHTAPLDGVAQHIGYKNAGNGAALSAIASLRYYGLLDRPKDGMASVSKEYESYRFAPNEAIKRDLITKWLKAPPVFAELLEKYKEGLPSDATLKFDLIQKQFSPATADVCLQVFRKSVDFARYYELAEQTSTEFNEAASDEESINAEAENSVGSQLEIQTQKASQVSISAPQTLATPSSEATKNAHATVDRIPVRLAGGRRAWIEIPMPFYEADKERLKKQIDLLLTDDEEIEDDLL